MREYAPTKASIAEASRMTLSNGVVAVGMGIGIAAARTLFGAANGQKGRLQAAGHRILESSVLARDPAVWFVEQQRTSGTSSQKHIHEMTDEEFSAFMKKAEKEKGKREQKQASPQKFADLLDKHAEDGQKNLLTVFRKLDESNRKMAEEISDRLHSVMVNDREQSKGIVSAIEGLKESFERSMTDLQTNIHESQAVLVEETRRVAQGGGTQSRSGTLSESGD